MAEAVVLLAALILVAIVAGKPMSALLRRTGEVTFVAVRFFLDFFDDFTRKKSVSVELRRGGEVERPVGLELLCSSSPLHSAAASLLYVLTEGISQTSGGGIAGSGGLFRVSEFLERS